MAFIISKQSKRNGTTRLLYYLVESYREKGIVRRRTIYKLNIYRNFEEILKATIKGKKYFRKELDLFERKLSEWMKDKDRPMFYYHKNELEGKIRESSERLNYFKILNNTVKIIKRKYKL